MARQAVAHVEIDYARRRRLLRHIAMTGGALHARANVRRVVESNVGHGAVIIDALPGNILSPRAR